MTRNVTAPGTPAYTMIHNNRGHSVSRAALEAAFAPTAVPMCQKNCNLDSVSFCVGRDEAGQSARGAAPPAHRLCCALHLPAQLLETTAWRACTGPQTRTATPCAALPVLPAPCVASTAWLQLAQPQPLTRRALGPGFPTQLQQCTPGTLGSANCGTYNCTSVNIPAYPNQAAAPSGQPAGAPALLLLLACLPWPAHRFSQLSTACWPQPCPRPRVPHTPPDCLAPREG